MTRTGGLGHPPDMADARAVKRSRLMAAAVFVVAVLVANYILLWTRRAAVNLHPAAAMAEVVVGLLWFAAGAVVGVVSTGKPYRLAATARMCAVAHACRPIER